MPTKKNKNTKEQISQNHTFCHLKKKKKKNVTPSLFDFGYRQCECDDSEVKCSSLTCNGQVLKSLERERTEKR